MGEPTDKDRLLYDQVTFIPPNWDDERSHKECNHCGDRFKKGHIHNCRLCGHIFCNLCTAKYYLPSAFDKKKKTGLMRVCFSCRDNTVKTRIEKGKQLPSSYVRKFQRISTINGKQHIHPPAEWSHTSSYSGCFLCKCSTGNHPFNCRLCGELFCTNCTIKRDIPDGFRKKNKTGTVRWCIECRYKVAGGTFLNPTKLDETQQSRQNSDSNLDLFEDFKLSLEKEPSRAQTLRGGMSQYSPRIGESPLRSGIPGVSEKAAKLTAPLKTLKVFKQNVDKKPDQPDCESLGVDIQVSSESSFVEINQKILEAIPALRHRNFHYLCRNKPIFRDHWSIFNMKYFPEIVIVKGFPHGEDCESVESVDTRGASTSTSVGFSNAPTPMNSPVSFSPMTSPQKSIGSVENSPNGELTPPIESSPNVINSYIKKSGINYDSLHYTSPPSIAGEYESQNKSTSPKRLTKIVKTLRPKQLTHPDAIQVKAKYQYMQQTEANVSFETNDILICIQHDNDAQWQFGEHDKTPGKRGQFPASYVEITDAPEEEIEVEVTNDEILTNNNVSGGNQTFKLTDNRMNVSGIPQAAPLQQKITTSPTISQGQQHQQQNLSKMQGFPESVEVSSDFDKGSIQQQRSGYNNSGLILSNQNNIPVLEVGPPPLIQSFSADIESRDVMSGGYPEVDTNYKIENSSSFHENQPKMPGTPSQIFQQQNNSNIPNMAVPKFMKDGETDPFCSMKQNQIPIPPHIIEPVGFNSNVGDNVQQQQPFQQGQQQYQQNSGPPPPPPPDISGGQQSFCRTSSRKWGQR